MALEETVEMDSVASIAYAQQVSLRVLKFTIKQILTIMILVALTSKTDGKSLDIRCIETKVLTRTIISFIGTWKDIGVLSTMEKCIRATV